MYIQHDSLSRILILLPLIIIRSHLNPLRLELALWSSPLPPSLASNLSYAMWTQLLLYCFGPFLEELVGYGDLIYLDPARMGDPLGSKALDVFNGIVRGV